MKPVKIEILSFTERGFSLACRLTDCFARDGDTVSPARSGHNGLTAKSWAQQFFYEADALLFVGAAGIAVRTIASFLASKTTDPAVLVLDEKGKYVIPILSGHWGGANALAERVAVYIGATPVITTATDVCDVFAVDTWAKSRGYKILNPQKIKDVSSKILARQPVGFFSPYPVVGPLPDTLTPTSKQDCDICVDIQGETGDYLSIIPKAIVLGVGCKKGAKKHDIDSLYSQLLEENKIHACAVKKVCSIDLKKDEPGLLAFCAEQNLEFVTYPPQELAAAKAAKGNFSSSLFVESVTGVDNVCERSAVLGSGPGGRLFVPKTVAGGVTMAAAVEKIQLSFGGNI